MHQTLSIINKGHIFMNFVGMILTFYIWICVVHLYCVHHVGQVLEDSSLQVWTILSISSFVLFCTESQIINADLGFQHFKLLRFTNKIEFLAISIQFSIEHANRTLHISCQLTLSEVNSTQILLIFESLQHCRNDQEQEKLLTHFCCWWWCFHASIFLALMLDAL